MKWPLIALTCALLSSCYTIHHQYDGEREITPGSKLSQESEKLGPVRTREKAHFLFWGLVDLKEASAPDALEKQSVADHGEDVDGITNVSIHEEQDAVDIVVSVLTLGIFSMITVESEGQSRRYTAAGGGAQ